MQRYGDADFPSPPEVADYLIHCHLKKDDFQLMLADSVNEQPESNRHGISLVIQCESEEEAQRLYSGLGEAGEVIMELHDTFWGVEVRKSKR